MTQGDERTEYEDAAYVEGVRDLARMIESCGTANWKAVVGVLDDCASMIELRTRERDQASLAGERAGMEPLDALAKHTNWELTHGGWEDEEQVWKVHSVNGGRNDREWTLLGAGETPAEAIRAAILKEAASITRGDV